MLRGGIPWYLDGGFQTRRSWRCCISRNPASRFACFCSNQALCKYEGIKSSTFTADVRWRLLDMSRDQHSPEQHCGRARGNGIRTSSGQNDSM
eukprot:47216-Pyramimonas_sp.AAC.1